MHARASCRRSSRANARASSRLPTPCGPWKRYACAGPSSSAASSRRFASCCSGKRSNLRHSGASEPSLDREHGHCARSRPAGSAPSSDDVPLRRWRDELAVAGVDAADERRRPRARSGRARRRAARARRSGSSSSTNVRSGIEAAGRDRVQLADGVDPEPARGALVGERRVDVAVADDPGAAQRARAGSRARRARRARRRRARPRPTALISGPSSSSSRIRSPSGVPPGSRTATTSCPCPRAHSASSAACVVLPEPSMPFERHEHPAAYDTAACGRSSPVAPGSSDRTSSTALVERGDDVVVVDNLSTGKRENLNPAATFVERDIRDGLDLDGADVVFHLAAQADVQTSVERPDHDAAVNVVGTVQVLEAARAAGAQVVFSSTGGAIYGECDGPGAEDAPLEPLSPYGIAKLCGEQYLARLEPHPRHGARRAALRERLRAAAGGERSRAASSRSSSSGWRAASRRRSSATAARRATSSSSATSSTRCSRRPGTTAASSTSARAARRACSSSTAPAPRSPAATPSRRFEPRAARRGAPLGARRLARRARARLARDDAARRRASRDLGLDDGVTT